MLLTILKEFGQKVWGYVLLASAIVAGLFALHRSGKRAGREEIEREQSDAISEQRRKINEADQQLAGQTDDDIRRRLADWVQRDSD